MSTTPPTLVGGRYELGELLGRGGMAEVRKGLDTRLGRVVAIKRLRTDLASDATFQARFRREAQSSAALNHPAIVAIYDTGEEWTETGGEQVAQPYIVMEFVAGRTLRDIIREGRKILPERALEITSGVLSALDYSHRAGIIHRDIKPGNVMLTPTGDVKVMDFGIARAINEATSSMTQTAAVVGTAQYLSPEQARGESVDSRSDVYSAGCLLYELLTGRPPFVGDSPVSVAYQHVREPVVAPSAHDPELAPAIDAIVLKALAKPVEERYQSAAAMRSDIERYLAGQPVAAPPPAPVTAVGAGVVGPATAGLTAQTAVTQAIPDEPEEDDRRRGRTAWLVAALLLLAVLVGVAAWFLPRLFSNPPETVAVPSLVNLTDAEARTRVEQANLAVGEITKRADPDVPKGVVISQDPDPGGYVDPGTPIDWVVSTGLAKVTVPAVVGQDLETATRLLTDAGFKVNPEKRESDETKNRVLETNPPGGMKAPEGSEVTVYYSDGPEKVPDVVGMQQDEAEQALRDAGFVPDVRDAANATEPKGTVVEQFPDPGQTATSGQQVIIFVSTYEEPPPSETPSPTETPSPSASP